MRSVAKGNYIRGKGAIKHAVSHIRYLELRSGRDKEELEGRRRTFISATGEGISGAEVRERIKQLDENKIVIHRIVLSPGIDGVDMTAYTRYVMSELENTKGRELEFYSTDHKNTEHDHAHLVILGSDENGKEIRLNRAQYRAIREASDRYLERHHEHTRYLDKDLHNLMRDGYVRDRGDDLFEGLLSDLKSEYTIEECEGKRKEQFVRLLQLKPLPKEEKIVSENVIYTKHSSLLDLQDLAEKLDSGSSSRISKEQYSSLQSWIRQKEKFGDDYHERTAQTEMMQRIFDENLKYADRADNSPPRSFHQYVFESRGRLLDWHERYTVSMQRDQLEKEIGLLKDDESDNLKRAQLVDHLEWLDELAQDRNQKVEQIQELKSLVPVDTNNSSNTERALESPVFVDAEPVDGIGISEQMFITHVESAFRDERNISGPQQPLRPNYVEPEPPGGALAGYKETAHETIEELLFGDAGSTSNFFQSIERLEIGLSLTRVDDSGRLAQEVRVADNLEQQQQTQIVQNTLSSPGRDAQFLDQQKDNDDRRRLDDDVGREHSR